MELAEPGHNDGGVAVTGTEARLQTADDAADFRHAGQAAYRAGQQHHLVNIPLDVHAGITSRLLAGTDHFDFISPAGFGKNDPEHAGEQNRQQQTDMNPGGPERRQRRRRRKLGRQRKIKPFGILPRSVHQVIHPQDRHIIEHQGGDDLVDFPARPQHRRAEAPESAGGAAEHKHPRQHHKRRQVGKSQRQPAGGESPHIELPFRANVPELHPERHRNPQCAKHQGNPFHNGFRQTVAGTERSLEHRLIYLDRITAGQKQKQCAQRQRRHHRQQRNRDVHGEGRIQPLLEFNADRHESAPPAA